MSDFSTDPAANSGQASDQMSFQVGERQYDAEAAAKKISNADEHIARIEAENAKYKADLEASRLESQSRLSVEEALTKLQNPASTQEANPTPSTNGLSAEEIGEIASKQLQDILGKQNQEAAALAAETKAASTFEDTKNKLAGQYGDKLEQVMNEKATSMGVDLSRLVEMASDPATAGLLLESMKVSKVATQIAPSGSFNTASLHRAAPSENPDWYKGSSSSIMNELQRLRQTN